MHRQIYQVSANDWLISTSRNVLRDSCFKLKARKSCHQPAVLWEWTTKGNHFQLWQRVAGTQEVNTNAKFASQKENVIETQRQRQIVEHRMSSLYWHFSVARFTTRALKDFGFGKVIIAIRMITNIILILLALMSTTFSYISSSPQKIHIRDGYFCPPKSIMSSFQLILTSGKHGRAHFGGKQSDRGKL